MSHGRRSAMRRGHRALAIGVIVVAAAVVATGQARAGETLGASLPSAGISATLTQGGPPNFADTFVTPYTAASGGAVASWRAQFLGGVFPPDEPFQAGPGVPAGIQLKVFRHVSPTMLEVVAAGAVHDPRPILEARFGGPFFLTQDSMIEFTDPGLEVLPGDLIGLTIRSDPLIGRYLYPLIGAGPTPLVLRDVAVGGRIDLGDIFTGVLPWIPAVQVDLSSVTEVRIDIKPGAVPNSINLGSSGRVPVAVFSTPTFDARTVDPSSVTLAGAAVALKGEGSPMTSFSDVDGDGLVDLVLHVDTAQLQLSDGDVEAVLEGRTFGGQEIRGVDSVRIVN